MTPGFRTHATDLRYPNETAEVLATLVRYLTVKGAV
jgi:hypothetical protein